MAATVARSGQKFIITTADTTNTLELGNASNEQGVGTRVIQFVPDGSFSGSITIVGRLYGQAAVDAAATLEPISYRKISINGTAGDYTIVSAAITTKALIQVPSNGISVGLLVTCSAGTCTVLTWDLNGPSAP